MEGLNIEKLKLLSSNTAISSENSKLKTENSLILNEKGLLKKEIDSLNQERIRLWNDNVAMHEDNSKFNERNNLMLRDIEHLKNDIDAVNTEKIKFYYENEDLKKQLEFHTKKVRDYEEELNKSAITIQSLQESHNTMASSHSTNISSPQKSSISQGEGFGSMSSSKKSETGQYRPYEFNQRLPQTMPQASEPTYGTIGAARPSFNAGYKYSSGFNSSSKE